MINSLGRDNNYMNFEEPTKPYQQVIIIHVDCISKKDVIQESRNSEISILNSHSRAEPENNDKKKQMQLSNYTAPYKGYGPLK